jgi:hypothetical protein
MIPDDVIERLKDIVIPQYVKEFALIGKEVDADYFQGYFDEYPYFNMIGDYQSFIIYDTIGQEDKVCKVIDVISNGGKAYALWGQLVKKYKTIYTYAYDDLPIVKRAYKKLGYIGTGSYNRHGQQLYVYFKDKKEMLLKQQNEISQNIRGKILEFESALSEIDGVVKGDNLKDCPLKHSFADDIYVREIFIPKGYIGVGKIHKHSHPNFLMKGKVSVVTEDKGVEHLEAPLSIISPPATKRVVYAHEDTVWITVHSNKTNTQDLKEIEDYVIAKDFSELSPYCLSEIKKITGGQL